ncbi:proline--tRNA ligase [Tistrella mobilis]|uniref:proline--tRNA ligase n=1 Tax=Tistrella mobilis TaxID=171437 RepID=UPI0031F6C13E
MSSAQRKTAIRISRAEDFPAWFQEVVKEAEMAEPSGVRGCMVIRPWGYGVWEQIQKRFDQRIRETGHQNCYFPIFIPLDLIEKEAAHVEGFAKEMAVVTHHRLVQKDGKLVPDGQLEVPLVVRPTSETVIGEAFARWIRSYRDLPLKINQWANVVRWEMRPRVFLRTSEFLWQEGHTAHATREEAMDETATMLEVYREVVEDWLAVPVIPGEKPESERFPGAVETHCIEAMMQDGKALQAGTSHFLGQNFSRAANIQFQTKDGGLEFAYTTSWGVSTRLIGALIMTHSDDDGLRLPPAVAPAQIVILPIIRDEASEAQVMPAVEALAKRLSGERYLDLPVRVEVDRRDMNAGEKRWSWIKRGVPVILEVGPRDVASGSVAVTERTALDQKKAFLPQDELVSGISDRLAAIHKRLYDEAAAFRETRIRTDITDYEAFRAFFSKEGSDFTGGLGFVRAPWCGTRESEAKLDDLGVTIRCLPYDQGDVAGKACVLTGAPATVEAIFAKSY